VQVPWARKEIENASKDSGEKPTESPDTSDEKAEKVTDTPLLLFCFSIANKTGKLYKMRLTNRSRRQQHECFVCVERAKYAD
jgi:hypothetical protein